ncbi:hypothetical protein X928_05010 [Petrotoga miotherma DSM 10691]|uniref:Uncharacterized protein n=1 Tax=Petrotoga miotherma DSM 10691 TaxID=1434326 RepID=A0A2K1PD78_9BACT|nr:hypothetical protein X928_05010 [Petrotoga miotherma DSM 10691]
MRRNNTPSKTYGIIKLDKQKINQKGEAYV